MNNFLYRLRTAAARFMYGRNGIDQLGWAILAAEIALSLVASFVPSAARALMHLLASVLWALLLYRVLSRRLDRRRAENEMTGRTIVQCSPFRSFRR